MSKADDKQLRREVILALIPVSEQRQASVMIGDSAEIVSWIKTGYEKMAPPKKIDMPEN